MDAAGEFRFQAADRVKLAQAVRGDWIVVERIEKAVAVFLERWRDDDAPGLGRMRKDVERVRAAADRLMDALGTMHDECKYVVEAGPGFEVYSQLYDIVFRADWFLGQRFTRGAKRRQTRHDLENHVAALVHRLGVPTRGERFEKILRIVAKAADGRSPRDIKRCATHARAFVRDSHRSADDLPPELCNRTARQETGR